VTRQNSPGNRIPEVKFPLPSMPVTNQKPPVARATNSFGIQDQVSGVLLSLQTKEPEAPEAIFASYQQRNCNFLLRSSLCLQRQWRVDAGDVTGTPTHGGSWATGGVFPTPPTAAAGPLALLIAPPPTVDASAMAVLVRPPPTVAASPLAMFSRPLRQWRPCRRRCCNTPLPQWRPWRWQCFPGPLPRWRR